MNRLIPSRERFAYLCGAMLIATAFAWATEIGPFIVSDTNGVPRVILGTDGQVQASSLRKRTATTNFLFEASDGTDRGGFTDHGVLMALNSLDAYGSTAAPTAANDTHRISVTFDTAEGDTVTPNAPPGYIILLTTRGVTSSAGGSITAPSVGDRYADSFEIVNPGLYGNGVTFDWFKIRTSNISP